MPLRHPSFVRQIELAPAPEVAPFAKGITEVVPRQHTWGGPVPGASATRSELTIDRRARAVVTVNAMAQERS